MKAVQSGAEDQMTLCFHLINMNYIAHGKINSSQWKFDVILTVHRR